MTSQVNPVLLPTIRSVLSSHIANQIIGVQPMTGPAGQIFNMKTRYNTEPWRVSMKKEHYQHFTLLYNRRRHAKVSELEDNGYQYVKVPFENRVEASKWCARTLKNGSWVEISSRFYFAYEKDIPIFALRFS